MDSLFDNCSLHIIRKAENALVRGSCHVKEFKNFAYRARNKRIGIAHCVSFPKETETAKQYLLDKFEVYGIDSKYGRITKHEMLGVDKNRHYV